MVEPEIHPPALCLLDDIASILLAESAQWSSRDVCETAREASVLKSVHMCIHLTVCLSHYWYATNILDLTLGSVVKASSPTEVNSYNLTKKGEQ